MLPALILTLSPFLRLLQLDDVQKYNKDAVPLGVVRAANEVESEEEVEQDDDDEVDSEGGESMGAWLSHAVSHAVRQRGGSLGWVG